MKVTIVKPRIVVYGLPAAVAPKMCAAGNCTYCGHPVTSTGGHPECWRQALEEANKGVVIQEGNETD